MSDYEIARGIALALMDETNRTVELETRLLREQVRELRRENEELRDALGLPTWFRQYGNVA